MPEELFAVSSLPETKMEKGAMLLEEGKPGSKVYVLKDGCVSVVAGGSEICKVRDQYAIFGEISLLLGVNATANVVVVEPSTFYVIDDLKALVDKHPQAALHIARVLAKRVTDMNKYYLQIKSEIVKLESNPAVGTSKKLWDLIVKMDRFWGREVL